MAERVIDYLGDIKKIFYHGVKTLDELDRIILFSPEEIDALCRLSQAETNRIIDDKKMIVTKKIKKLFSEIRKNLLGYISSLMNFLDPKVYRFVIDLAGTTLLASRDNLISAIITFYDALKTKKFLDNIADLMNIDKINMRLSGTPKIKYTLMNLVLSHTLASTKSYLYFYQIHAYKNLQNQPGP